MRCPTCQVEMVLLDDEHYQCPACLGEFFPAAYFGKLDEEYLQLWELYKTIYYKALRDERETYRQYRKFGFLRIMGREREDWEAFMNSMTI
jgi:Zn-finger nucleic acid-binding protein